MHRIHTHNRRIVSIAGGSGTGKTYLARGIVWHLRRLRVPAIAVSSGQIYRTLALIADQGARTAQQYGEPKAATDFTAAELVDLAVSRGLTLRGGHVWLDRHSVPDVMLSPLGSLAATWGGDRVSHNYASELIRRQIEDFDGLIIVEGRSVNAEFDAPLKLYFTAGEAVAARRKACSVEEIRRRDAVDRRLEAGPLQRTGEDIIIRTDDLSPTDLTFLSVLLIDQALPALEMLRPHGPQR